MRSRCRTVEAISTIVGHGDAVRGEVRHRGRVELDVGHGGERRGQRRRRRRGARRAPLVGPGAEQVPREHGRADREQPDRDGERVQRVGGGGRRPRELALQRGQRVERRRVVQRVVGLDVAQLAHVGRRRLAGVEDEPDGVRMPDRVPGAREWTASAGIPRIAAKPISAAPSTTPARTTRAGPHRRRQPLGVAVAEPGEKQLKCATASDHDDQQCDEGGPHIPRDAERADTEVIASERRRR